MTRQVTDQLYIEIGYLTPEDYYTYVAEAESQISAQATMSVTIGVIKSAEATMAVTTSVTATISHIEGADLFAFTEAALAAEVSRIRDNNIETTAQFSIAIDAVRGIYVSAQADSESTVDITGLRVRYNEAALDAAFSLDSTAEIIIGTTYVDGAGDWTAQAALIAGLNQIKEHSASLSSSTDLSATISHIEGADLSAFADSNVNADVSKLTGYSADLQSSFDLSIDFGLIKDTSSNISSANQFDLTPSITRTFEGSFTSAFSPVMTVNAVRNTFAVLDTATELSSTANVTRSLSSSISSTSTVNCSISKIAVNWWTKTSKLQSTDFDDSQIRYYNVNIDSNDDIYAFGTTTAITGENNQTTTRVLVTKFDSNHNELWSQSIVDTNISAFMAGTVDSSGNSYILAFDSTNTRAHLSKFNSSGTTQWARAYKYTSTYTKYDYVTTDSSGNVYITGTNSSNQGFVTKINSSGTTQWTKQLNTNSVFKNAIDDGTYLYVLAHEISSYSNYLLKLSLSTGATQWIRQIKDNSANTVSSMSYYGLAFDSTGNIVLNGSYKINSANYGYLAKYNTSGSLVSSKVYNDLYIKKLSYYNENLYALSTEGTLYQINETSLGFNWAKNIAVDTVDAEDIQSQFGIVTSIQDIFVNSSGLYASGFNIEQTAPPNINSALTFKLPLDGSGLPEYAQYSYADIPTEVNQTLTSTNRSITLGTSSPISSTLTLTLINEGGRTGEQYYSVYNGGYLQQVDSAIDGSFNLTATGSVLNSADANLTAQSALTTTITKAVNAEADISASGSLLVAVGRLRPFASLEDTAFDLSAQANVIRKASSNLTADTAQTTTITKTLGPISAELTTTTQLTATARKTTEIALISDSFASLAVELDLIASAESTISSSFTQTTTADSGKFGTASLSSAFAQTVDVTKTLGTIQIACNASSSLSATSKITTGSTVEMSANGFVVAVAGRLRPFASLEDTAFTVSASAISTKSASASLSVTSAQTTNVTKTLGPVTASLQCTSSVAVQAVKITDTSNQYSTTATVNATANATKDLASSLASEFNSVVYGTTTNDVTALISADTTQNTNAVLIAQGVSNLTSQFTTQATGKVVRKGISLEFAFADISVEPTVYRSTPVVATATSQLTANPQKVITAQASLTCQGFVLAIGRQVLLDSAAVWKVPAEVTTYSISAEVSSWTIPYETREYIIKE